MPRAMSYVRERGRLRGRYEGVIFCEGVISSLPCCVKRLASTQTRQNRLDQPGLWAWLVARLLARRLLARQLLARQPFARRPYRGRAARRSGRKGRGVNAPEEYCAHAQLKGTCGQKS